MTQTNAASSLDQVWEINGSTATLNLGDITAHVELFAPQRGIRFDQFGGNTTPSEILGVDFTAGAIPSASLGGAIDDAACERSQSLADAFVRGTDLIATYDPTATRPFYVQIYWRACVEESNRFGGVVLDAIVAMQTRLWEAQPGIAIASIVPGDSFCQIGDDHASEFLPIEELSVDVTATSPGSPLVIRSGAELSYIESQSSRDFDSANLQRTDDRQLRVQSIFSPRFMERGVIRKVVLRAGFVAREGDVKAACQLADQLVRKSPELTA